jgi:hypothetical protein
LLGRVLVTALIIVGMQWLVITHPGNRRLLLVVLEFPASVRESIGAGSPRIAGYLWEGQL